MLQEIIFDNNLLRLSTDKASGYLAHIICRRGTCTIHFNDKDHIIKGGEAAIFRATHLISKAEATPDTEVKVIYITPAFIEQSTPESNYGIRGSLLLFNNPIMQLNKLEFKHLWDDFCDIEERLTESHHQYYKGVMVNKVQMMILDFFDCHIRISSAEGVKNNDALLIYRFHQMLERGDYRHNRRVDHYASELCVVPKYLTEVSKRVCGFSASYWINRYAVMEIIPMLRDKNIPLTEIADRFNFSSLANFSRYIQRHLGMSPSEIRTSGA